MSKKFDSVPIDEGTSIIFQTEALLGDYDVLYQKWKWDGITAESIIFLSSDVLDLSDEDIEKEVRTSPLVKPDEKMTIKRSDDGFTFVNFNFETE